MMRVFPVLVAVPLLLSGCAADPAPVVEPVRAVGVAHELKTISVTFAGVGDSITAQSYQGSLYPWQSWVLSANQPGRTVFIQGGYAVPGRTTVDMLAGTIPLNVDVLVFEGAVNDVNLGYPHGEILTRIAQIVARAQVEDVIISALPPNDRYPAAALAFNAELKAYSVAHGWTFVDPWIDYRQSNGTYVPGAAWDDLHPVETTAIAAGVILANAVFAVAYGQKVGV